MPDLAGYSKPIGFNPWQECRFADYQSISKSVSISVVVISDHPPRGSLSRVPHPMFGKADTDFYAFLASAVLPDAENVGRIVSLRDRRVG